MIGSRRSRSKVNQRIRFGSLSNLVVSQGLADPCVKIQDTKSNVHRFKVDLKYICEKKYLCAVLAYTFLSMSVCLF